MFDMKEKADAKRLCTGLIELRQDRHLASIKAGN
jgi:hypothetical protein